MAPEPWPGTAAPDRGSGDCVLIVDDQPDNLALLHDALDAAGYAVLVATDGASALQRAHRSHPDVVLLDAMMPGMDGFEVARRLKADPDTAAIPIVFMTALAETDSVVAAYEAGAVDYVTKPIQPREVLARIAAHTRGARLQQQARNALDAFGHATMVVRATDGRLVWQTPLARNLLREHFGGEGPFAPVPVVDWIRRESARAAGQPATPMLSARGGQRLTLELHPVAGDEGGDDEWLIVSSVSDDATAIDTLARALRLTPREAEVLLWVSRGKTNRDIGEILAASPRTVTKHMEHILGKLGVETRTAAAGMALARLRG